MFGDDRMKFKRVLALVLSFVLMIGSVLLQIPVAAASTLDYTPGDLKVDGVINSTDVVYLRRYIAGGYGVTLDERAADVNADGTLNTTDVVCIRRYIAGGYGVELKPAPEAGCQHIEVTDPAQAPTCDTTGLTEGKHCSVCGEVLVKQETVPATGHTEVTIPAQAPTCDTTGLTEGKHCSVCGTVLVKQTVIAAKGHAYKHVVTAPNYTTQGYTTHTCITCGHSYIDSYTPATGYTDMAVATQYLREQLVARNPAITLNFNGVALTSEMASKMFQDAIAHTGVPNEGDYIRVNMGAHSEVVYTSPDSKLANNAVVYYIEWYTTAQQEAEVDAAVDRVIRSLDIGGGSEYERIKASYDWVTEYVQYDFDNLDEEDYKLKYTPYAAMIDNIAVCQGYAGLYYRLALELGIDCRYISGNADGERHGWNIVRLDGKYYNMDPTWDRDLMGHYRQFLCTEANFKEHVRDSKYNTAAFHAQYPMAVTPYVFNVTASGTVNANISWVLDGDTGTLTVAGKGAIPSYRYSYAPWYDYRESVKSIVVGEGITEVGERAFYWSTNCTSVTLPSTLTAIREYGFNNLRSLEQITLPNNLRILEFCAFSECVALKSIVLPDSVTTVETNVFSNCYALTSAVLSNGMKTVPSSMFGGDCNLTSVVLPKGVTYIDDTAFINAGLRSITIPATVTGLGTAVFSGCKSLTAIYVEAGNTAFKDVDGVLFSADGKTLICYPSGKYGYYSIPSGTVKIAYGAFRSARVTGLAIPGTLTTIEGYAFSYCTNLMSIAFPANVTRIGDSAFRGCSYLSSVTFYNDSVILESAVFADCDALTGITLPAKLTEIPNSLFFDCGNLRSITIPSTVTRIGSSAFIDCDNLTSVTVPGNVKSIGQQAFDFCNRLQTIILEEGVTSLGWIAIRNAPALTKVVLPSSLTSIDRENFTGCPKVALYVNCGTAGYQYAINNGYNYCASHPYTKSTVIAPTCTAEGYTRKSCACGLSSYTTNYVPAKGHSYAGANCTACGAANPDYAENVSLCYDDHYDVTGKAVEIIDAGKPTSYQVGYGVEENTVPDTAVITLDGGILVATGIGTAKVKIDGVLHEITVEAAPISLLLLIGQSNMRGSEGNADQSIVCPDGMVYATFGDDRGDTEGIMNINNATNFAASALTGEYSTINVNGTTDNLSYYPINSLTEAGKGTFGPDSGFAYEWVKQTGEKVWIVNAAHGGSSITSWQPNATDFKEAVLLFGACQETLRKEIAAGHFTLSHMGYFWCQGCSDYNWTAEKYVTNYLAMHDGLKASLAFDHDSNATTDFVIFEFAGIIPVRAGHDYNDGYREAGYTDTTSYKFYESFMDLQMTGPRVAQYWMCTNPELEDIWLVCNVGENWVWMPDGTNGVSTYFQSHYANGTVDYQTQVAQKISWYTPTTPAAVHDSIHYNQIGYNEVGRESARNALIMLGVIEAPNVETTVELVGWDGYTPVSKINASLTGNSGTLVVPKVYPVWKSKDVSYSLTEGFTWSYYDILASDESHAGTLIMSNQNVIMEGHTWDTWEIICEPSAQGPGQQQRHCSHCDTWETRSVDGSWQLYKLADHLTQLPEYMCGGVNLWDVRTPDNRYFTGTGWSGSYNSITIPVKGGDKIYATSLGKAGTNGHASISGHRITYFDNYGVLHTQGYGVTAPEFDNNGGYLIVPEGTVAINIPMWNNSDENEVYILNREHLYQNGICTACGGAEPAV